LSDVTADFFDGLATRGTEPLVGHTRATVRFDIVDGRRTDHWRLAIDDGRLAVSRGEGDADCVLRADKAAFERVASGRTNAMAATIRGLFEVEGDPRLLVRVQRLFPAPTGMPEVSGDRTMGKRRS
jgi:putative sterol carrier protein